ncbi:MAG: biotin--[acetyl-CoA-carboxylase] ligase [bacterium]
MKFTTQWFDEVDSTNTALLERVRIDPELPSGTVWAARMQTAGRGRLERKWNSPPGRNLLCSLYYRSRAGSDRFPSLTMAVAIGIDELLHGFRIGSNLKWPNDVLVKGRKIAGLLAERTGEDGVVIGIGLNVNMTAEEASLIDQPATSLRIETGTELMIDEVLKALLKRLPPWLLHWEEGGFSSLRERWIQGCGGLNASVTIRHGERRVSGTLAGFGENGELLLRLPDGHVQTVWTGDVVEG